MHTRETTNHLRLQYYSLVYTEHSPWSNRLFFFFFFKGVNKTGKRTFFFMAQNDDVSTLHAMTSFPQKYLVFFFASYETLYNRTPSQHFQYERGHLAKNNIKHSHGFINTTWGTFNNSGFINLFLFLLKSNSPEPFFQGVFLVSTYRSF